MSYLAKFSNLPSRVKVGNKYVGDGEPTFFIAEIGNNHNGDYFLAKRTIEEAVKAGADAVKLQKRSISDTFARELREREQIKDQVYGKTYEEYRRAFELTKDEFLKLKDFSKEIGTIFFATPFDLPSVDFLEDIGVDVYKIASFDVRSLPLLEYVAKTGKPMFLSAGMSTLEEIDEAVETILKYNSNLMVMHCVSVYPTPDDKFNLRSIPFMKERYHPLPIGYSGHENDILPTLSAVTLGATCVERHLTLDRRMPGPDHATVSIEPQEFKAMVDGARRIEKALGTYGKGFVEDERRTREKHSKSIVSRTAIPAGTVVTADMVTFKSPGYGLKPNMLPHIVGKTAKVDIGEDIVIKEEDIQWS